MKTHLIMETTKSSNLKATSAALLVLVMSSSLLAAGQITTTCTSSMITSFTPCVNFLLGSTNGGGSPSADCCSSLASLVINSAQCACLMLTGNVPFSLPINRTLAITLPRMCKSTKVPLQCQSTATPIPVQGPATNAPSLSPLPPFSSSGSAPVSPPAVQPALSPPADVDSPPDQGIRPLIFPSSAEKYSLLCSQTSVMLILIVTVLVNKI